MQTRPVGRTPHTAVFCVLQVSSIGLYLSGLCVFAVLLALVEQSVLQVYETRVELGSPVQETVRSWQSSSRQWQLSWQIVEPSAVLLLQWLLPVTTHVGLIRDTTAVRTHTAGVCRVVSHC